MRFPPSGTSITVTKTDVITLTPTLTPSSSLSSFTTAISIPSPPVELTTRQDTSSTTTTSSLSTPLLPATTTPEPTDMAETENDTTSSNRTLIITLATVLSVVTFFIVVGAILICWRRHTRVPFFNRGLTPIDDEEIERWKRGGLTEKRASLLPIHTGESPRSIATETPARDSPTRMPSAPKGKKPPSVIVYTNAVPRTSGEGSPRSLHSLSHFPGRKASLDIPPTPVLAKAPNARPGLCDEAIPGAEPFIGPLRRQPSKLSKMPPTTRSNHLRSRSSRSSISSRGMAYDFRFGSTPPDQRDWLSGYHTDGGAQLTPRASTEFFNSGRTHSRVYSSNSIPPRLSLSDDIMGGLSPPPALLRSDIGRAIG